ncbi:MAG: serine/threonine-protein kinase [Gemmataceae bacterium]
MQATLSTGAEPFPGYRLIQLLGRGGFASVWQATTPDGNQVALKFLECGSSTVRELRAQEAVRHLPYHPNIIQVHQVWAWQHYIVVCMELAEGSLQDLLEAYQAEFNTPVVPEHVCLYLTQSAEAIDFLNARQHTIDGKKVAIQHCDIKPSNILLVGEHVKLSDFGLSTITSSFLQSSRKAGTLDFMAPEIFQGRISDRVDQYALAVTYVFLRTGKLPFPPVGEFRESYVRPNPDLTMLPAAERPIIAKGLERVPHQRWPSCVAMMTELTKLIT